MISKSEELSILRALDPTPNDRPSHTFVCVSARGEGPTSIDDATPAEWDAASARARELLPLGVIGWTAPGNLEELAKIGLTPKTETTEDLRRRVSALQAELEQERLRAQVRTLEAEIRTLRHLAARGAIQVP